MQGVRRRMRRLLQRMQKGGLIFFLSPVRQCSWPGGELEQWSKFGGDANRNRRGRLEIISFRGTE
jgi:hypothetical protein